MPGNKNSGRKKKKDDQIVLDTEECDINVKKKKKRGRPKKEDNANEGETVEKTSTTKPIKQHSRPHAMTLQKRTSELSLFYDEYVGPPLDNFPASKLPVKRVVLQRYRRLKADNPHTMPLNSIVEIITKELIHLWTISAIPFKNYRGCWDMVKKLINKWINTKQEERKSVFFQEELNTLLDLRPANVMSFQSLEDHLRRSGNVEWKEDCDFFKGQLTYPQTSLLSPTRDKILDTKMKRKATRAAKAIAFEEKHRSDVIDSSSSTITQKKLLPTDLSPDNIVNEMTSGKRESLRDAITKLKSNKDESKIPLEEDTDEEWQLPYRTQRRLRQKPKEIVLTLPSRSIPSILAGVSTLTKTSSRHELKLVSTLLKHGGADIESTTMSISTIRRQRKSTVEEDASQIREGVKKLGQSAKHSNEIFLVLHCDGKIIQYLSGEEEDRIAIGISVPNLVTGQFLASPAIPDGTGQSMANCLFETLQEYGLKDILEAVVFDTTASNTGKHRGCVTLLEKMMNYAFLWLACRHHVSELFIKHADEAVRGPSKGPDDQMFKAFKKIFNFIDVNERETWLWPVDGNNWRSQRANDVLRWADMHMTKGTWPREDYRELVELTVLFLGGVVKRLQRGNINIVECVIRKPGALHRARFMASSLYLLKIFLFRSQFPGYTPLEFSKVEIMAEYIALLHVPYFLKSPLAISAPRQDRDFWNDLSEYKRCFEEGSIQHNMIDAVKESVTNHLWYLTAELVIFGLFDDELSTDERRKMADQLLDTPRPQHFSTGKPSFPLDLMCDNPSLHSFIGERSWLLFQKMKSNGNWLHDDVELWKHDPEYQTMRSVLVDLKVVNDLAERCVKDVQTYADLAKDSKYREDILIVATDHRGIFQDLRKGALR